MVVEQRPRCARIAQDRHYPILGTHIARQVRAYRHAQLGMGVRDLVQCDGKELGFGQRRERAAIRQKQGEGSFDGGIYVEAPERDNLWI